jgi:hypothetical protein
MKIKIITILASIAATLLVLSLANCIEGTEPDPISTSFAAKIKGNTYVLGTVMNGTTNVTSEFTGLKLAFSGDGTSVTITSPTKLCLNGNYKTAISGVYFNRIGSISITGISPPSCMNQIFEGETSTAASTLSFAMNLPPSTPIVISPGRTSGVVKYNFELVKQ